MNVAAMSNVLPASVPTEKSGTSVMDGNRPDITFPLFAAWRRALTSFAHRKLKRTIVAIPANSNPAKMHSMSLLPSHHSRIGKWPELHQRKLTLRCLGEDARR
jgi:hypothetical protein